MFKVLLLVYFTLTSYSQEWKDKIIDILPELKFDHVLDSDKLEAALRREGLPVIKENGKVVLRTSLHGLWRFRGDGSLHRFRVHEKGDRHALAIEPDNTLVVGIHIDADHGIEEALKFSRTINIMVKDCVLKGGSEDVVDIISSINTSFINNEFHVRGARSHTIKIGALNVDFIGNKFLGRPIKESRLASRHYIDIGNWGEYEVIRQPKTAGIRISDDNTFEYEKKHRFDRRNNGKKGLAWPVRRMKSEKLEYFKGAVYKMPSLFHGIQYYVLNSIKRRRVVSTRRYYQGMIWRYQVNPDEYPRYQGLAD